MKDPIATEKGYIDQEKQMFQYTQAYPNKNEAAHEDSFTYQEPTKRHKCGAVLTPFTPKE